MLQFGYISDRIVVGDLFDDADHDLFIMVCHSHHSLNHLLPPKRIFTNLRARAGHPRDLSRSMSNDNWREAKSTLADDDHRGGSGGVGGGGASRGWGTS